MGQFNDATLVEQKKTSRFFVWLVAVRPRTLPISLPPIILATVLAARQEVVINWFLVICSLACALSIQVGTNLINDAIDFRNGVDTKERLGIKRPTQEGLLPLAQVMQVGCAFLAAALFWGIPLITVGGWPLFAVLIISVICGYLYTGGPFPLANIGVSDFCILLFFGWVSTLSVYYILTESLGWLPFIAATQIGFLAIVPHAINNLRDMVTDEKANKRTLAVRFGYKFARIEIVACSILPFIFGFFWMKEEMLYAALLPLLVLPLIIRNLRSILNTQPSALYNQYLAKSAICQLLFACYLAIGICFS